MRPAWRRRLTPDELAVHRCLMPGTWLLPRFDVLHFHGQMTLCARQIHELNKRLRSGFDVDDVIRSLAELQVCMDVSLQQYETLLGSSITSSDDIAGDIDDIADNIDDVADFIAAHPWSIASDDFTAVYADMIDAVSRARYPFTRPQPKTRPGPPWASVSSTSTAASSSHRYTHERRRPAPYS